MTRTHAPRARVIITRFLTGEAIPISDDLISLNTTKTYGRAAGGWQLSLPFKKIKPFDMRYDELFRPDDIITIEIDAGDGNGFKFVMFGLVSRVARATAFNQEGIPQRVVKLTGQDMGKLLLKHDCGWNIQARPGNTDNPEILQLGAGLKFTGTPVEMVWSMLKTLFLDNVTTMAPYFDFYAPEPNDDWEIKNTTVFYQTGAIWNALKNVENEHWNVLTTETSGTVDRPRFRVILEKIPIDDRGKVGRYPLLEINPEDIIAEDFGVSDDERVNYFWYKSNMTAEGIDDSYAILTVMAGNVKFDNEGVKRHGFTSKTLSTDFYRYASSGFDESSPGMLEQMSRRSDALWNRLKLNHTLQSGSIKFHISPDVKAGCGVLLKEDNMECLVEAVEHNMIFSEKPSFTTTISVTRGQPH